jgi:hypothetical protein
VLLIAYKCYSQINVIASKFPRKVSVSQTVVDTKAAAGDHGSGGLQ